MKQFLQKATEGNFTLDLLKAVRVEAVPRGKDSSRKVYVFKCREPGCSEEIRVRQDALKTCRGYCKPHVQRERPFESIYRGLFRDQRKPLVTLTYEQYLAFTLQPHCHYCSDIIRWQPYGTIKGKFTSRAYFLDQKNSLGGYTQENCVVCCTECNKIKGNRFSYPEFVIIGRAIKLVREARCLTL